MKSKDNKIYELITQFPESIKQSYEIKTDKLKKKFKKIVVVGMGACYTSGLVLQQFLKHEIDVEIFQDYDFELDKDTLLILLSYSGNTREVLKIFNKFKNKKNNLLVLTSGGKLLSLAKKEKIRTIQVPANLHPRFTFSQVFFPAISILEKSKIIKSKKKLIQSIIFCLIKNEKFLDVEGKKISVKLKNKTPLFYASDYFYPVAYRLQASLEEDAKVICHSNKITELFHNELEALPNNKFYPILILDKRQIRDFKKQIGFFKRYIKNFKEFKFYNYTKEKRMFLGFYFTEFLSYYLSKLEKINIRETPISDEIKKK